MDPNSPIIWAVRIVVLTLLAMFGHSRAAAYEREFGSTPWSLPKGMWAFLWALGLLPGLLLWLIANGWCVVVAPSGPDLRFAAAERAAVRDPPPGRQPVRLGAVRDTDRHAGYRPGGQSVRPRHHESADSASRAAHSPALGARVATSPVGPGDC